MEREAIFMCAQVSVLVYEFALCNSRWFLFSQWMSVDHFSRRVIKNWMIKSFVKHIWFIPCSPFSLSNDMTYNYGKVTRTTYFESCVLCVGTKEKKNHLRSFGWSFNTTFFLFISDKDRSIKHHQLFLSSQSRTGFEENKLKTCNFRKWKCLYCFLNLTEYRIYSAGWHLEFSRPLLTSFLPFLL